MKYDLFLSDFDGTLLRSDGTISEITKRTIARYRAQGGVFALCTGRGLKSILPRVRELGITEGLVVASQGAVIADIATGELLKNTTLELDDALEVLRWLEERDCHIHYYTADDFFANRRDGMLDSYEKIYGRTATVVGEPLSRKAAREKPRMIKILVMKHPSERDAFYREVQNRFGEKLFVTCSSPWLVEVLPQGQTKGAGVKFLSDYYHIPKERIAAAGDQLNDVPMLMESGGRFAVANAVAELKKIAVTIPSNDEDGVAAAIGKYAMGEEL